MNRILFIDTETGGINPNKHSLLSIGLVVWDQDNGIIYENEFYIKSEKYAYVCRRKGAISPTFRRHFVAERGACE